MLNLFSVDTFEKAHKDTPAAYFRGFGMLLSNTCQLCDLPSVRGGIFALRRLCKACSKTHQPSFAVGPSRIDGFMITKGELKKAGVNPINIALNAKSQPFTTKELYSVKALEKAALTKYKTAAGVEEAGAKKKKTAKTRFEDSQDSAKPMKKRSKIEDIVVYNGDLSAMHRHSMADFYNALPLGFLNRFQEPVRLERRYTEKHKSHGQDQVMMRGDILIRHLDLRELKANITDFITKSNPSPEGIICISGEKYATGLYPVEGFKYFLPPRPDEPLDFNVVTPIPSLYGGTDCALRSLEARG